MDKNKCIECDQFCEEINGGYQKCINVDCENYNKTFEPNENYI